jgi:hypothetical protein
LTKTQGHHRLLVPSYPDRRSMSSETNISER